MMYRHCMVARMNNACEQIKAFNSNLTRNELNNPDFTVYSKKIAKIAEKNKIDFEIVLDAAIKDLKERQGENA